jgi:hypothetical protein
MLELHIYELIRVSVIHTTCHTRESRIKGQYLNILELMSRFDEYAQGTKSLWGCRRN